MKMKNTVVWLLMFWVPCHAMMDHPKKITTSEQALTQGNIETFKTLFEQEKKALQGESLVKKLQFITWKACHGGLRLDHYDLDTLSYLFETNKCLVEEKVLPVPYSPNEQEQARTPVQTACRYRSQPFVEKLVGLGARLNQECLKVAQQNWLHESVVDYVSESLKTVK